MDFTDNPMAEPEFKFYDKSLLDDVKRGDPNVHEFFRLLALCHTVMPEYKEGTYTTYIQGFINSFILKISHLF